MAARLFFILSIVACGYLTAISQGTPAEKDDVIKVDTHIVEVPVVITDKTGSLIETAARLPRPADSWNLLRAFSVPVKT